MAETHYTRYPLLWQSFVFAFFFENYFGTWWRERISRKWSSLICNHNTVSAVKPCLKQLRKLRLHSLNLKKNGLRQHITNTLPASFIIPPCLGYYLYSSRNTYDPRRKEDFTKPYFQSHIVSIEENLTVGRLPVTALIRILRKDLRRRICIRQAGSLLARFQILLLSKS